MIYFYCLTIFLLVLAAAQNDSSDISKNIPINHIRTSIKYAFRCIEISLAFYLLSSLQGEVNLAIWLIKTALMSIIIRAAFFDFALNLFRKLPIGYISKNANGVYTGAKESKYDDLLYKIGVNANVVRITFIVLFFVLLFLI